MIIIFTKCIFYFLEVPNRKKATSAASSDSKAPASSANEDISQQVDPASATITVTAVEVEELSEAEQRDRLHLERRVERAVFEAGKALAKLRDRLSIMTCIQQ
ncbi:hypothetical protein [Nostoc sp.]